MYLAIDIGATKVLLAVFTRDGELVEQLKFATDETYEGLIRDLAVNIAQLSHKEFTQTVVAVPGRLDRRSGVALAFGNRSWTNVPIKHDVQNIVHSPVAIENDAKVAALSEAVNIKDEFKKVLYVTISTGISAGLVVNGVIDADLADSESGHMRLEHHGKLAMWQDFASGKAIVAKYGKRASEITDPHAWKVIAHNIAIGLVELVAVIQPEVIVLGGGVGTHFAKFKEPLLAELNKYDVPMAPIPPIRRAKHPEEAVIYGCYLLAKQAA